MDRRFWLLLAELHELVLSQTLSCANRWRPGSRAIGEILSDGCWYRIPGDGDELPSTHTTKETALTKANILTGQELPDPAMGPLILPFTVAGWRPAKSRDGCSRTGQSVEIDTTRGLLAAAGRRRVDVVVVFCGFRCR